MEEKQLRVSFDDLLEAGVHFGHLKRKWNPNMAPYIFMERKGIHIIDLYKTQAKIEEAASALKQIAKSGKQILFVATKKQAQEILKTKVERVNMPYVTERWPGGMLTNFGTIRRTIRKMKGMEKLMSDNAYLKLSKRERLQIEREKAKMEKQFGSIADMNRLPSAIFVVDIIKEYIAIREAQKLDITTFAMVDTNSNPEEVDFPIPANDDASKSIDLVMDLMVNAVEEGLNERKMKKKKLKPKKPRKTSAKSRRKNSKRLKQKSKKRKKKPKKRKWKLLMKSNRARLRIQLNKSPKQKNSVFNP
ncbi:MAG: 30S ribosomal protein S2 [Bacteroidales bacterium]